MNQYYPGYDTGRALLDGTLADGGRTPYRAAGRIAGIDMTRKALLLSGMAVVLMAQTLPSFDVASVKGNKSGNPAANSNFPLGPGAVYSANGGHFTATNFSLVSYIFFAYRIVGDQAQAVLTQLPGWVTTDRFDILANTDGDPAKDTKDQMRLMMRSLLAERFKMVSHYETRQVPILAAVLVKPGKTGPQLQPHPADAACSTAVATASGPEAQSAGWRGVSHSMRGVPANVPKCTWPLAGRGAKCNDGIYREWIIRIWKPGPPGRRSNGTRRNLRYGCRMGTRGQYAQSDRSGFSAGPVRAVLSGGG